MVLALAAHTLKRGNPRRCNWDSPSLVSLPFLASTSLGSCWGSGLGTMGQSPGLDLCPLLPLGSAS